MDQEITIMPPSAEDQWRAVEARDYQYDGVFVYAVRSTGIYCRPSCPSRRPQRDRVAFFNTTDDAEQAGFRACRRCRPQDAAGDPAVALVREVCRLINNAGIGEVTLEALGSQLAVSPDHLQRTFKRAVGITPRQYADTRRMERFKMQLRDGLDVTHALYEAGYSSSSRLYEQAPAQLGMTPASYRRGGAGVQITYALSPCVLGVLLVAATERGICKVSLGDSEAQLEADLVEEFSAATLTRDDQQLVAWVAQIARHVEGRQPRLDVPLDIRATAFQRQVWEQLQAIPYGTTRSYQAVADAIGRPTAARAVAQACASNPVALVIPCHRVVGANGGLSGYRWGIGRKQALLTREAESTGDGE